jgi:hypothetical protein
MMQAANADTRNMKPLVALVIIMGVLIVAGLVVVVVTIVNRMSGTAPVAATSVRPSFGTVDLPVPAGCQVVETTTADDRLILRLGSGDRCNQLLVVDMASGAVLGTLRIAPAQ